MVVVSHVFREVVPRDAVRPAKMDSGNEQTYDGTINHGTLKPRTDRYHDDTTYHNTSNDRESPMKTHDAH
jgi:hypothetical protein